MPRRRWSFGRLYANAQNHLRKLRDEDPGAFVALDKLLTEVSTLLPASPPRRQLSFQDQGRFALGYYHQRARQFEQIAEHKAARERGRQELVDFAFSRTTFQEI